MITRQNLRAFVVAMLVAMAVSVLLIVYPIWGSYRATFAEVPSHAPGGDSTLLTVIFLLPCVAVLGYTAESWGGPGVTVTSTHRARLFGRALGVSVTSLSALSLPIW